MIHAYKGGRFRPSFFAFRILLVVLVGLVAMHLAAAWLHVDGLGFRSGDNRLGATAAALAVVFLALFERWFTGFAPRVFVADGEFAVAERRRFDEVGLQAMRALSRRTRRRLLRESYGAPMRRGLGSASSPRHPGRGTARAPRRPQLGASAAASRDGPRRDEDDPDPPVAGAAR